LIVWQSVILGQGLILCTGDDVEWDNKFNGLVVNTKVGGADVSLIGGMTNKNDIIGSITTQWYGMDVKGEVAKKNKTWCSLRSLQA